MGSTLQRINFEETPIKFKGKSGIEYTVTDKISAGRWNQFEIERLAITLGLQADEIYDKLFDIYQQLEEGKLRIATAAVQIYDLMSSIKDLEEKKSPVLRLAALISNSESEEIGQLPEEQIIKKVSDFEEISVEDFFFLILNFTPKFHESYKSFLELDQKMNLKAKT